MARHYDWLVVGAGFTGAVFAERVASRLGQRVLVIDRRDHVGGNAHDFRNEHGILCHRYGPHVFHTNSAAVVRHLSAFTRWRRYEHRCCAMLDGRLVPLPFSLTSLDVCFAPARAARYAAALVERYGVGAEVTVQTLCAADDTDVRDLGRFVFDAVFRRYTAKQWGRPAESLDPSVTARLPVRVSHDDRYFVDRFQRMPLDGYGAMFSRMLSHPLIDVRLRCDAADVGLEATWERMLYTGGIDAYFGYRLGALPYRTVDFEFRTYSQPTHLPVGMVTFPDDRPYTRISEARHLTGESGDHTTVCLEYPREHRPVIDEPCYPVPAPENHRLHEEYRRLAAEEAPRVVFAGRLGDYRYINMDQAVGRALAVFRRVAEGRLAES